MSIPEIRATVFEHLDRQTVSTAAAYVGWGWTAEAARHTWHDATADDLLRVAAGNRDMYGPSILTLSLGKHLFGAAYGWRFPQLRVLRLHYLNVAGLIPLLNECGHQLHTIQILTSRGLQLQQRGVATTAAAYGGGDIGGAVFMQPRSNFEDNGHVLHEAVLRPDELALLAGRKGLVNVAMCGHMFVNTSAVNIMRTTVVAPFASLKRLKVTSTTANDAVDLLARLPRGALVKLKLELACGRVAPILHAVAEHQQNLRQVRLKRCRLYKGAELLQDPVHAADFYELSQLRGLEDFRLAGGGFTMTIDEWRMWLSGLPNLLHLDIASLCILPPEAVIAAGHCCRKLYTLRLNAPTINYTAIEDDYTPLPFPRLVVLHMTLPATACNYAWWVLVAYKT